MRDPLAMIIALGCAVLAVGLWRATWKEARAGESVSSLLPGMPQFSRSSSPKLFMIRQFGFVMAGSLATLFAVVMAALWFGIL